jgi:hypothetical protein
MSNLAFSPKLGSFEEVECFPWPGLVDVLLTEVRDFKTMKELWHRAGSLRHFRFHPTRKNIRWNGYHDTYP